MYDLSSLPREAGDLLLITDNVAAPGDFVILSLLQTLKQQKDSSLTDRSFSIMVSFLEPLPHWTTIGARLSPSLNLPALTASGAFTFLDALATDHKLSLKSIHDATSQWLGGAALGDNGLNVVILDGLTSLSWTGTKSIDIIRFLRAIRALCAQNNAYLVVRHHPTSSDLDELSRFLLSQSSLHIEVMPLLSGKSGSVSGEVAVHSGPLARKPTLNFPIGRLNAIQYRLTDSGPHYFGRGTSASVL